MSIRYRSRNLAERILEREEIQMATEGGDGKDRLMIMLQHVHLPLLADTGLLQYEPTTKELQGAKTDLIESRFDIDCP
ncbi:MAG: hypothetical protein U5K37_03070 [Natrialbaceae archaeon]|nr:hypothetical protein [Natrialbaceae archaeon]